MAAGKAVVSTTIGAEGLPVKHGDNILLADEPESIARCIVELLSNSGLRTQLGDSARRLVAEGYSWRAVGKTLANTLEAVANRSMPTVEGTTALERT